MRIYLVCICLLSSCTTQEIVVYSSGQSGNSDIWMMDQNGSNKVQLTKTTSEEWAPTIFSESKITFLRQEGEEIKRILLDLETKKESEIAQPNSCILDDKNMQYGPISGRQLYQCNGNIFIADAKGENEKNLTDQLEGKSFKATWSIDESLILFTNQKDGNQDIYSIQPDGKGLRQMTNHSANEEAPDLSPDGRYLLFSSNRDGDPNQELYILELANQKLTNITNTPNWELIGRWSNNGKHIYYGSNKDGNWEIYRYDLKDQSHHRLTDDEAFDGDPRVLPRR